MRDRSGTAIPALVLAASGLVLAAPVLGRNGAESLADAAMVLASCAGVGAFALAALRTWRSARNAGKREEEP
jgi:uncharacterized membrane protein YebE (DUF533 family)